MLKMPMVSFHFVLLCWKDLFESAARIAISTQTCYYDVTIFVCNNGGVKVPRNDYHK